MSKKTPKCYLGSDRLAGLLISTGINKGIQAYYLLIFQLTIQIFLHISV